MSGPGGGGDGGEGARVVGTDDGLLVHALGHADARAVAAVPGIRQCSRALAAVARAGIDQRAGDIAGAGVRQGGSRVAPAVVLFHWGKRGLPTQAEEEGELAVDAPVVLDEPGEVRPLLADVADGVDAAVSRPAEEERGKGVAAGGGEVGVTPGRRCRW